MEWANFNNCVWKVFRGRSWEEHVDIFEIKTLPFNSKWEHNTSNVESTRTPLTLTSSLYTYLYFLPFISSCICLMDLTTDGVFTSRQTLNQLFPRDLNSDVSEHFSMVLSAQPLPLFSEHCWFLLLHKCSYCMQVGRPGRNKAKQGAVRAV